MVHLLDLAFCTSFQIEPLGKPAIPHVTAETESTRRLQPREEVACDNGSTDEPSVFRSTELSWTNHNKSEAQRSEGKTDCPSEAFGVCRLPDRMRMEHY